ncbi:chorismate mutase [Sediminicoccus sp. BL-A-41-H5]|uniref:chorismate mutase n=1 Tax=Sediminicoccus sp. BL-A-41-H5 TaxID=3421106 RepID=UPI003D676E0B
MSEPKPDPDTLEALRAEINSLDDAMHDLLMRRAEVVHRLGASQAKPAGTVLRPGREAAILRRLLARHSGPLPRPALVRLWRELFASSVAQQGNFSVALPADPALARLAAEHFGVTTPQRQHPSLGAALAALGHREASIAVLPWPRESDNAAEEWWTRFDAAHLSVIARLPFVSDREPPLEAAVIGLHPADPSGRDATLLRVEMDGEPSRSALAAHCGSGRVLIMRRGPGFTRALVETLDAPPAGATILGRYAIPERGTK